MMSQLNLVDLAGSEKAGQTGAEGIRYSPVQCIKFIGFLNKKMLKIINNLPNHLSFHQCCGSERLLFRTGSKIYEIALF